MNIPLIIIVVMYILSFGFVCGKHNCPKVDKQGKPERYNAWSFLISYAIMILLALWSVGWSFS